MTTTIHRTRVRVPALPALLSLLVALLVALLVVQIAGAGPAMAHDTTGGGVDLRFDEQRVHGSVVVRAADLGLADSIGGGGSAANDAAAQGDDLLEVVRRSVEVVVDGAPLQIVRAAAAPTHAHHRGDSTRELVTVTFTTSPHDGAPGDLRLRTALPAASGSRAVIVQFDGGTSAAQLDERGEARFTLGSWAGLAAFFNLGIGHITGGIDHVLFLVVLTLSVVGAAVTRASLRRLLLLVSCFTIGHALSLVAVSLDLVTVPGGWVEPTIAASIVIAAVAAMRREAAMVRPALVGLVGVVHGLGFASSLAAMHVGTGHRVVSLAAFNLGIDLAQTAFVVLVAAACWAAQRSLGDRANLVRVGTAAVVAVVGLGWTAERLPF